MVHINSTQSLSTLEQLYLAKSKDRVKELRDHNSRYRLYRSPLHEVVMGAISEERISEFKMLLKTFDINVIDAQKRTPLHLSIISGQNEWTKMLIKEGADIECKDKDNATPLEYARLYLRGEIVTLIEELQNDIILKKRKKDESEKIKSIKNCSKAILCEGASSIIIEKINSSPKNFNSTSVRTKYELQQDQIDKSFYLKELYDQIEDVNSLIANKKFKISRANIKQQYKNIFSISKKCLTKDMISKIKEIMEDMGKHFYDIDETLSKDYESQLIKMGIENFLAKKIIEMLNYLSQHRHCWRYLKGSWRSRPTESIHKLFISL
jgi:hypothetical protein